MFDKLRGALDTAITKATTRELSEKNLSDAVWELQMVLIQNDVAVEVAEHICEVDRWHAGRQNVLFTCDPLLPSTPRSQHEHKGSWNRNVKFKETESMQPHDNPFPNKIQCVSFIGYGSYTYSISV